jgi:competence protein ComEA
MESFLIQNRYKIFVILLIIVFSIISYYIGKQSQLLGTDETVTPLANSCNLSDNVVFYYEVAGQVNIPGVYTSTTSTLLVKDAIETAGGLGSEADLAYIYKNIKLAVTVVPGEKIYVPAVNESYSATTSIVASDKLNINTASIAELDSIYGVGEITAKKIIAARPFTSCEEINNVEGINSTVKKNVLEICQL